jgi:hypothetical protein
VGAVADRGDGGAGGANQLADSPVGDFWMVTQNPGDAVGFVLTLRYGRVAGALGPANRFRPLQHLKAVIRIAFTLVDFLHGDFMRANRVAAGIFGSRRIVCDRLHFQDVKPAEFRDLIKAQRGVVDQPTGCRVGHERLGHRDSPALKMTL